MDYARSDGPSDTLAIKILIAGGFGVGKTTLVSAVSEIQPLSTEELLSDRGTRIDDTSGVEGKTTTTVALDFGRITLREGLWIYLFGTPGQDRFWFMWDELAIGALGAVVLADTRRLGDAFPAVDFFEQRRIPYMVAVNQFDGARRHDHGGGPAGAGGAGARAAHRVRRAGPRVGQGGPADRWSGTPRRCPPCRPDCPIGTYRPWVLSRCALTDLHNADMSRALAVVVALVVHLFTLGFVALGGAADLRRARVLPDLADRRLPDRGRGDAPAPPGAGLPRGRRPPRGVGSRPVRPGPPGGRGSRGGPRRWWRSTTWAWARPTSGSACGGGRC